MSLRNQSYIEDWQTLLASSPKSLDDPIFLSVRSEGIGIEVPRFRKRTAFMILGLIDFVFCQFCLVRFSNFSSPACPYLWFWIRIVIGSVKCVMLNIQGASCFITRFEAMSSYIDSILWNTRLLERVSFAEHLARYKDGNSYSAPVPRAGIFFIAASELHL